MKASFKGKIHTWNMRITWAFILALLVGGDVLPGHTNPNSPGDMQGFDDDALHLVIEEGRAQIDRQNERFRHATDRGQVLLTVDLALLGFMAALLHHLLQLHGKREEIALIVWGVSALLAVIGTATAAAVVAVKATFGGIDTTIVSGMDPPILKKLAEEYAGAVRTGELTADLRVTAFRSATRITVWAGVLAAIAFGISA